MNIGIPNLSATQAQQGASRYHPAGDIQPKASTAEEAATETPTVQPGMVAALREAALQEAALQEPVVRPEMIEKGSAFLLDPNYPPLDSVNGISSLIIDDFFSNYSDSSKTTNQP